MAPRTPEISALRLSNPKEWVRRITRAMKKHDGFLSPAAAELDISRGTLQAWIHRDERLADVRPLIAAPSQTRTERQGVSLLGALRISDPTKWVRQVTRAVRASDGYLEPAAEQLGVSRRTLQRWINEDERLAPVRAMVATTQRPR